MEIDFVDQCSIGEDGDRVADDQNQSGWQLITNEPLVQLVKMVWLNVELRGSKSRDCFYFYFFCWLIPHNENIKESPINHVIRN